MPGLVLWYLNPNPLGRDNGKEHGNHRSLKRDIIGLYWGYIGILEKENGSYYLGFRDLGLGRVKPLGSILWGLREYSRPLTNEQQQTMTH